ncbi:hypothetical protein Anapl_05414 [Anas platyrhynchos]|uniref:Uncharacterized protein n=1 Tax=Anas platyrhynchos TaxID=8839 RepID=R0L406_ANAPL|nr:hypothetical protein Anapl_05414 [Anas platyrhynchos]
MPPEEAEPPPGSDETQPCSPNAAFAEWKQGGPGKKEAGKLSFLHLYSQAAAAACLFPCGAGTNKTGEDSDLHVPFSPTYCLGQLQAPFQEKPLLLEPEFNHVTKAHGVLKLSTPAAAGKVEKEKRLLPSSCLSVLLAIKLRQPDTKLQLPPMEAAARGQQLLCSLASDLDFRFAGKSPKWTPGKAGSLLVLPNCWEGKWNSKLLKQHWVECTEERSHLCKAEFRRKGKHAISCKVSVMPLNPPKPNSNLTCLVLCLLHHTHVGFAVNMQTGN